MPGKSRRFSAIRPDLALTIAPRPVTDLCRDLRHGFRRCVARRRGERGRSSAIRGRERTAECVCLRSARLSRRVYHSLQSALRFLGSPTRSHTEKTIVLLVGKAITHNGHYRHDQSDLERSVDKIKSIQKNGYRHVFPCKKLKGQDRIANQNPSGHVGSLSVYSPPFIYYKQ